MKTNFERLNEITGGDEDLNAQLIGLFKKTFDKCLGDLKICKADGTPESQKFWHDTVHELKGAAGNLGFDELYDICKKYEMQNPDEQLKAEAIKVISALQ